MRLEEVCGGLLVLLGCQAGQVIAVLQVAGPAAEY
jgi:hypothetical protein